ncbi:MAG: AMP-binding protein [Myxococcales bacterium]|nr:MAG: AMP-binding protein [Myxococcales bacterium]
MSFAQEILDKLKQQSDRVVLQEVHGASLWPYSANDLIEAIARARFALREAGLRAGHRAVFVAPNSFRWVACDLAIIAEGGISVPLYVRQEAEELEAIIQDSMPSVIVVADEDLAESFKEKKLAPAVLLLDQLFTEKSIDEPFRKRNEHVPATLVYTSGTSGASKGAMLSQANLDFMLHRTAEAFDAARNAADDRVFHYLPFCFAGSRVMLWTCLLRGAELRISTDLEQLKEEMKTAQPHYFLNVPALLERIRKQIESGLQEKGGFAAALFNRAMRVSMHGAHGLADRLALQFAKLSLFAAIRRKLGPALDFLICGSAPLQKSTQDFFSALGIPVYQVYGLTETTAIVSMDKLGKKAAHGFVGQPIEGVECRVSEDGELQTRGPHVFMGYWGKEEESNACISEDGWFRTGDQVEQDSAGNLQIIGRLKNILVPESGHNVAPEPIEQSLHALLPEADYVVVVGHGRPYLTAIISGKLDEMKVKHTIDTLNESLPHYRRIRAFHLTEEPFTPESGLLTANQKLRRQVLEEHYQVQLNQLYT